MIILDGREAAKTAKKAILQQVKALKDIHHKVPHLAIVLVGNDPASLAYVHAKLKACQEVGFQTSLFEYATLQEGALLQVITQINQDSSIDGLIVQLPLPSHICVSKVLCHIDPTKDVDGLHPLNYGNMARGLPAPIPATPLGILNLLAHYGIETQGLHCVVVGRGMIVGAPLSILLSSNSASGNATTTLCHSYTQNLRDLARQADLLVAAVGKPRFITADMVKPGAIVVDVGITRVPDNTRKLGYRLLGDVDFEQVAPRCSYITPVPGGVGPMTIVQLLQQVASLCTSTKNY